MSQLRYLTTILKFFSRYLWLKSCHECVAGGSLRFQVLRIFKKAKGHCCSVIRLSYAKSAEWHLVQWLDELECHVWKSAETWSCYWKQGDVLYTNILGQYLLFEVLYKEGASLALLQTEPGKVPLPLAGLVWGDNALTREREFFCMQKVFQALGVCYECVSESCFRCFSPFSPLCL